MWVGGEIIQKKITMAFLKYLNTAIYLGICTSQLKIII